MIVNVTKKSMLRESQYFMILKLTIFYDFKGFPMTD